MATLAIVTLCRDNNSCPRSVKVAGEVAAGFAQNSSSGLTELISSASTYIHTHTHSKLTHSNGRVSLPFSQFLSAEEQTERSLIGIVPKQMPCPTLGGNDAVRGGGLLDQVTVPEGSWSGWLYLPRAEGERLSADQHTRYTGSTQGPCRRTRPKTLSGYERRREWWWMGRLRVHAEETWWGTSGARAATRQHTLNPKTLAPMLPSGCVVIFPLLPVNPRGEKP